MGASPQKMRFVSVDTVRAVAFDFCATPIAVRYLRPDGTMLAFVLAFGVVGIGVFVNMAWSYAVVPELRRALGVGVRS